MSTISAKINNAMVIDFQHHFAPRELVDAKPGAPRVVKFDATGAPAHTSHSLLMPRLTRAAA